MLSRRPRAVATATGPWIEVARTDSGVLLADTNGVDVGDALHAAVFMKFVRTTPTSITGTGQRVAAVVGTQEVDCVRNTRQILDAAALDSSGQPLVEMNELRGQGGSLGSAAGPLCAYIRAHSMHSPERAVVDQWVKQEVSRTGLNAIAIDSVGCAQGALANGIIPVLLATTSPRESHFGDTTIVAVTYAALGVARATGSGYYSFDSAAHFETALFKVRRGTSGNPGIICGHIPWNHVSAAEFDRYRDRLDSDSRAQWDSVYRKTPPMVTLQHLSARR